MLKHADKLFLIQRLISAPYRRDSASKNMILVVGLGNPGQKYKNTRHNVGFRVVEELAKENDFPDFRISKRLGSEINEGEIAGQKIILAKPQTFMNNSGRAVKLLTKNYKLKTINLILVHDDIDLPLGKIKIVKNRGAAGHKGVESIIRELKTKNFIRFRVGIYPTTDHRQQATSNKKQETRIKNIEDFVLKNFTKEEEKILKKVIEKMIEAIWTAIREGVEKAMSKYN